MDIKKHVYGATGEGEFYPLDAESIITAARGNAWNKICVANSENAGDKIGAAARRNVCGKIYAAISQNICGRIGTAISRNVWGKIGSVLIALMLMQPEKCARASGTDADTA